LPRFECVFKDGILTIDDNKDYVSIFPDNINVTAIVGENGSGKSSILKFILMLIFYTKHKNLIKENYDGSEEHNKVEANEYLKHKNIEENRGYLILKKGSNFYKISMVVDTSDNNGLIIGVNTFLNKKQIDLKEFTPEEIDFYTIHFNYMLDTLKDSINDNFIDTIYHKSDNYETSLLLEPYKRVDGKEQISINNLEYLSQQKFANIFKLGITNKFIEKFFNPNFVELKINLQKIYNKIDILSANVIGNPIIIIDNKTLMKLSNKDNLFQETNPDDVKSEISSLYENQQYSKLNKIYIALKILEKNYHRKFTDLSQIYHIFFETKGAKETIENTIKEVERFQDKLIPLLKKEKIPNFEIQKLINSINFESKIIKDEKNNKAFAQYLNRKKNITQLNDLISNIAPWIDIEYFENDKSYKSLSSGEKTIFSFMINLIYQVNNLKETKYSHINLLLDETELGLHPQWQKEYLNYILMSLKDFDINIHLTFATHSPFILSDIPKENVIFLEKYDEKNKKKLEKEYPKLDIKDLKNGNCINASEYIELKTFGANIHTLLSNGFFMSDGFMGEFAKEKIKEILNFLNDKEELKTIQKEQIKPIIESIGEDFLRNKLLDLYYKHKDFGSESKERKKQILDEKIRKLEEERDKLND
jgi:predicted ATPase